MGQLTRRRAAVPSMFDKLREDFDRTLKNWWSDNGDFENLLGNWQPSVDIAETDDSIEVKVDLPGIKPEDIEISVADNRLTIKGERREEQESKEKEVRRVERSYGSFYRSIALPAGCDADQVSAESDNGVITIRLPKPAAAKAKRISVKAK